MDYAPVIIPTLCRFSHFKRCIDTLSRCSNAQQTQLYVFLDYPKFENHQSGHKKIKELLPKISGFKTIKVIERKENFGAIKNLYDGIDYVLKFHDKFILTEDDNEFSPNFLDYINKCFEKYKDNRDVVAITGYNRMIDMSGYSKNIYAAISYSAWGVGFTKDNFQFLQHEVINKEFARTILQSWNNSYTIYQTSPSLLRGLLNIIKTGKIPGDTLVVSYMILNKKYCIWPTKSKVRNHGYDGGGEHFGSNPNHPMLKQEIDAAINFEPDEIEIKENETIKRRTREYARLPLIYMFLFGLYIPLKYLIYRFTGIVIYK